MRLTQGLGRCQHPGCKRKAVAAHPTEPVALCRRHLPPMVSKNGLRRRGWTRGMVERFAPPPDAYYTNPMFSTGRAMHVWLVETIEAVERKADFRAARLNADRHPARRRRPRRPMQPPKNVLYCTCKRLVGVSIGGLFTSAGMDVQFGGIAGGPVSCQCGRRFNVQPQVGGGLHQLVQAENSTGEQA